VGKPDRVLVRLGIKQFKDSLQGASPVGHEAGGTANTEEAVGDKAGAVVAGVVVVGDVLVRHDQHPLVRH